MFTIRVITKGHKSQKNSREHEFRLANHKNIQYTQNSLLSGQVLEYLMHKQAQLTLISSESCYKRIN